MIALGSDHGGFDLKERVKAYLDQMCIRDRWYTEEQMESLITGMERDAGNHLLDRAQLYGMEGFALDQLDVMEGDLSKLYEPGGRYIAAVYNKDDYGKWRPDSHWAKDVYKRQVIGNGEIGPLSQKLYDTVTGIQLGRLEDKFGWRVRVD